MFTQPFCELPETNDVVAMVIDRLWRADVREGKGRLLVLEEHELVSIDFGHQRGL